MLNKILNSNFESGYNHGRDDMLHSRKQAYVSSDAKLMSIENYINGYVAGFNSSPTKS
jgi:hypothetical protein